MKQRFPQQARPSAHAILWAHSPRAKLRDRASPIPEDRSR